MIQCKILPLIIIVLSIMICGAEDIKKQPQWELSIQLDKNTFLMREPIWLDIELTNVSNDTLRIWSLYPGQGLGLEIELTNSDGDTIPYSGPVFDFVLKEGTVFQQGDVFYDSHDLIELFAIMYTNSYHFASLAPDNYIVQAFYGDAVSREIGFKVTAPTGVEKQVEQKLLDALSYSFSKDKDSLHASLQKAIEQHPKSVYAEIPALRILSFKEFLDKFPNSGNTKTAMEDQTRGLSPEEKKTFLENVMVKYKNTRAARHAAQALRLLRKAE